MGTRFRVDPELHAQQSFLPVRLCLRRFGRAQNDNYDLTRSRQARGACSLSRYKASAMTTTRSWKRSLGVLVMMQALMTVTAVVLATVNGLAGLRIAPDARLATLPVTAYVVGGASSTFGASLLMARVGRRAAFVVGIACGMLGALVCAYATHARHFWLLCVGSMIVGVYGAFSQYHRFAAADVAPPEFLSRAVSLVLAGGVVGAIVGPESAKLTKDLAAEPYVGSYLSLVGVCALALIGVSQLSIPHQTSAQQRIEWALLGKALQRFDVVVAIASGVVGYAVMIFLMTATPLAMQQHAHHFQDTALVIEWHVLGMYAPAFVTGSLIKRWGVRLVITLGALLMLVCIFINLSGVSVGHFWTALLLLGIGWNFMFVGGTTLLAQAGTPKDKALLQGTNEVLVFAANVIASITAGVLLHRLGWQTMNQVSLPFLLTLLALTLALGRRGVAISSP